MRAMGEDIRDHSYLEQLTGAARENPVAAGLIGLGIAWMFVGGKRMRRMARPLPGLAQTAAQGAATAASRGVGNLRESAAGVVDTMKDAAESVQSAAGQVSAKLTAKRSKTSTGPASPGGWGKTPDLNEYAETAHSGFNNLQERVSRAFEEQPLLVGAAGLALGAVVAAVFRSTDFEEDLMGETAASLNEQAAELLAEAKLRAARAAEAMQEEAAAQGLSAEGAREQLKDTARKVGEAAKNSFRAASE